MSEAFIRFYYKNEEERVVLNPDKGYFFGSNKTSDFLLTTQRTDREILPIEAVLSHDKDGWFLQYYNREEEPISLIAFDKVRNFFKVRGCQWELIIGAERKKRQFVIEIP